jgi:hypothetical protein
VDAADRSSAQARGFTDAKLWAQELERQKREAEIAAERERQRAAVKQADADRKRYNERLVLPIRAIAQTVRISLETEFGTNVKSEPEGVGNVRN